MKLLYMFKKIVARSGNATWLVIGLCLLLVGLLLGACQPDPATPSNDASLRALTIEPGTLTPVFAPMDSTYDANVASSVESITVTPTVTQGGAIVTVNDVAVVSGAASEAIELTVGATTPISIVVTAPDSTTTQTYTINGIRPYFSYVCENGTAARGDAAADGLLSRCLSCNHIAAPQGTPDTIGATCNLIAIGAAQRVGSLTQFGVSETSPSGLAAVGDTLYMVAGVLSTVAFYRLDPRTGIATNLNTSLNYFGVDEALPVGLAAIDDKLYMMGYATSKLYTLNIDSDDMTPDGMATPVGTATLGIAGTPADLAAIDDKLYMATTTAAGLLYTININTDDTTPDGMAIRVSSADVIEFGQGEMQPVGLAAIGNTLYMVGSTNNVLYTLNTATGEAMRVGMQTNFGRNRGVISPQGLAVIDNILYMAWGGTESGLFVLRYE